MKTKMMLLYVAVALTCATINTYAQTESEETKHLTFRNIPIDGTRARMGEQIEALGYTHVNQDKTLLMMRGEFASYSKCLIGISSIANLDIVYKVYVLFPEKKTWRSLYEDFNYIREMLTNKYGKPKESIEEFEQKAENDSTRIMRVKNDLSTYCVTYELNEGTICLQIDHDGSSCYVMLTYTDTINYEKARKEAMNDL